MFGGLFAIRNAALFHLVALAAALAGLGPVGTVGIALGIIRPILEIASGALAYRLIAPLNNFGCFLVAPFGFSSLAM